MICHPWTTSSYAEEESYPSAEALSAFFKAPDKAELEKKRLRNNRAKEMESVCDKQIFIPSSCKEIVAGCHHI